MTDLLERDDADLQACWQQTLVDAPDAERRVQELAAHVTRFDRNIGWRNGLEYAAGLVLVVWGGYRAMHGSRQALSVVAGALFVMGYLWWTHRSVTPLDPSADARTYRDALLARIDFQIRLLGSVRYWYLLPLYVPGVWQMVELWPEKRWRAVLALLVVTIFFAGVAWLNEVLGVRKLTATRAAIETMFEEKKP